MARTSALVLVLVTAALMTGCGASTADPDEVAGAGSPASGAAAAGVPAASSAALPMVSYPPPCRAYELPRGGVEHDQTDVIEMAERVQDLATKVEGFTSVSIDSVHQVVAVYWAGEPPERLQALDDADPVVSLDVRRAVFSAAQLDVPSDAFFSTPLRSRAGRHLYVVTVAACHDGSGLRIGVADRRTGTPDSVPPSVAAEIQSLAGAIPVLVVPASPIVPLGGA